MTTADGSVGIKGFVTDAVKTVDYSVYLRVRTAADVKAVYDIAKTSGQFSFEERMGCGFGACMGCSCKDSTEISVSVKTVLFWKRRR